jgi:hypothetical protein
VEVQRIPSGLIGQVDKICVNKQADTLSTISRVDQLVYGRSRVVLEYMDRREKVKGSPVFVDSSRSSCVGHSEEETSFSDVKKALLPSIDGHC